MKTNNFQNLVKFSCLGFSLISLQQLALASPVQASSLTGQFEIEGLLGEGNNSLSNNSFEILFTEEPSVATTGNILTEQLIFHSSTGNAIAISQASGGWSHQSLRWEYTFGFEVEEIEYTLELSFEDEQQMAFVSGTLISPIEDTLTVSSANISQVPEPLTILGAGTALGFGTLFKRKLNASKKEKEQIS